MDGISVHWASLRRRRPPPSPPVDLWTTWRPDAAVVAAGALALSFVLPSRQVVAGLGAAGRPSLLLGFAALGWWASSRLVPGASASGRQPLRIVLWLFVITYLASLAAAYARAMPLEEVSGADRSVLRYLGLVGLALLVVDGVTSRARLDAVLQALLAGSTFMALVGALQFLFDINLTRYLRLPGLVANAAQIENGARGADLARVAGTAGHYIEFGVILAMLVTIALHYGLHSTTRGRRRLYMLLTAFLTLSSFYSVSRSAVVALGIALVLAVPGWTLRRKLNAAIVALAFLVVVRAVQPGLLGTLRSLFGNVHDDPSIEGRTKDYEVVAGLIRDRPWLGRGPGTYSPERYVLLDNQWLNQLITNGSIGVLALAAVFVTAFILAKRVGRWGLRAPDRNLGHALAGTIAAAAGVSFFFDSLSFSGFAVVTFVIIGAAGALWRLADEPHPPPLGEWLQQSVMERRHLA